LKITETTPAPAPPPPRRFTLEVDERELRYLRAVVGRSSLATVEDHPSITDAGITRADLERIDPPVWQALCDALL
jgi:uncharacterized protein YjiS (DUF1127 family)